MSGYHVEEEMLRAIIKAAILEADAEKEKAREEKYLQKVGMKNSDHIVEHSEWRAFKSDWTSLKKYIVRTIIGFIVVAALGIFGTGLKMTMNQTQTQEPAKIDAPVASVK